MDRITRCPHCASHVYRSAKVCPHCEEPMARRRLFGRGTLIFIAAVVVLFAVGDTIYLLHVRRNEAAAQHLGRSRAAVAVQAFLHGNDAVLHRHLVGTGGGLGTQIEGLQAQLQCWLPADVRILRIDPLVTETWHPAPWGGGDHASGGSLRYGFDAIVRTEDRFARIAGSLCMLGRSGRGPIICFDAYLARDFGAVEPSPTEIVEPQVYSAHQAEHHGTSAAAGAYRSR